MRIRLKLKPLIILTLTLLMSGGGIFALHRFQLVRTAGTLVTRADRAGRDGKASLELDLLRRYLAIRPADTAALERFGLLMSREPASDDRLRGLEVLDRVLGRDPSRLATRRRAAALALELGQMEVARSHYTILEAAAPDGDPLAEAALGRCAAQLKQVDAAVAWLRKAIQHDPGRVATYDELARLLRGQSKRAEQADAVMDARAIKDGLIRHNGTSGRAYLARATYRHDFAIPGAADDITQGLTLTPDDPDLLAMAARCLPVERAIPALRSGVAAHPGEARLHASLARLEAGRGELRQAIDDLNRGIRLNPTTPDLRWLLSELLIDDLRLDAAEAEIKRLRDDRFPVAPLDFLAARIAVQRQDWTRAERTLAATTPALDLLSGATGLSKRAYLLLARCYEKLDNPDARSTAARRALAAEPKGGPLDLLGREELAAALAGTGQLDEAVSQYRSLGSAITPARQVDLVRVLIRRNLQRPAGRRDWAEIDQILEGVGTAARESTGWAVVRAEVLVAKDQQQLAVEQLNQARTAHPDDMMPGIALANLAERQGRWHEALTILEAARTRHGDQPELLTALTRFWSGRPGAESTQALEKIVAQTGVIPDATQRRSLLRLLADGFDRLGEQSRAAALRADLLADQPDHLGLRVAQFDACLLTGDMTEARRMAAEVRRTEGTEGVFWRYSEAQILIEDFKKSGSRQDLDAANRLLTEVRSRRPSWTRATLVAAEVADLRGDLGAALRGYLAAIEEGEQQPRITRRAVLLLCRRGRQAEAAQVLDRVAPDMAQFGELRRLNAELALRMGDDPRALELARRLVPEVSTSAADLAWLGQILIVVAQHHAAAGRADATSLKSEAERALRRAIESNPTDPTARTALVLALVGWNRLDEARGVVADAAGRLTGPAGELALARCYEAVGQNGEAQARYRALIEARPDDVAALQAEAVWLIRAGKMAEAEAPLRHLIALQPRTPREAAWARRILALALSLDGPNGSAKALKLLGLDEAPTTTAGAEESARFDQIGDDLRAQARVLARRPGQAPRRRAIEILDRLIAREEARPDDLFFRAQLLAADGDWKRARAGATQLLADDPANAAILLFLAEGQINAGPADEAKPSIDQLARGNDQAPAVTELRAQVLLAAGQVDAAVASLDALVRRDLTTGFVVARLLERAGQPEPAAACLRRLVAAEQLTPAVRADASLALAALLGRRGQHAAAIAICERCWDDPSVPAARVATVALTALYSGSPDEAVLDRVEARIAAACRRTPADLSFQFDRANLAMLRGRYDEAEASLRALHQAQRANSGPLNNLAWLLALRGQSRPEALDLIEQAITLDGPLPELLDTRGLVLVSIGQVDRGVADLEAAVAANPSAGNLFHLAIGLRKAGRDREAADAWAKARRAGLRAGDVHPLERPAYLALANDEAGRR